MKFKDMRYKEWITALFAGVVVGALFTVFGFPLPAPPTIGGFMGILGVFLGTLVMKG